MKIEKVTAYTPELKDAIDHLLRLLTGKDLPVTEEGLKALIAAENSHLFVALDEQSMTYMGMITIGIYLAPTGCKAWIEDVVVDNAFRGQGIGRRLTEFAIGFTKQQHVNLLSLTSKPARVAANNLYRAVGFTHKETNVYVMPLG